jgi:hypothetical protein
MVTLATQRTGTKAFAQALNTGSLVTSVYEVFMPNNKPASLTRAWAEHLGAHPDCDFSPKALTAFLDGFFDGARARIDRDWLHFDVMYDNLGTLSPVWTYPIGLPHRNFLLGYLRSRGIAVVHLVRDNILDCYASVILAQTRNLYHTDKPVDLPDEAPIRLDPERALHYVLPAMRTRDLVREAFRGNRRYVELTYPDFIADDRIAPDAVAAVARTLGLAAPDAQRLFGPVRMRPTAPDKQRVIANYDEVAAHIAPHLARLPEGRGLRW